ncbi:MAG: protein kinase [Phycisphaerae bacterium]|nr:protein kinase [Phycisphaerae bacterium]
MPDTDRHKIGGGGPDSLKRAHAIFKELLETGVEPDDPARDARIDAACNGDEALRRAVRRLYAALATPSASFDPAIGRTFRAIASGNDESKPPPLPKIPGFRIERLVGVGGMAAVYEAIEERTRRRVALKVLRRSMVGAGATRRFEFETEVLAKLKHPAIATMYGAGTFDDGVGAVPYFAMEFVEGAAPITTHCRERGLSVRERLELLRVVCDAVQHGHDLGVIHRDVKAGNVLVDAKGAPRVIDFGIARSLDTDVLVPHQTTAGQIIGTLDAMSPEQCTPHAVVDARTDVYSLGVLAYELVVGRPPFDFAGVPFPEAMRRIHDVTPPRPSAIDPSVSTDLDAIILTAIEKEPARRYRTVAALGEDLRRYLANEPIEARPPTMLRQIRLFARRNRPVVVAACTVVGTLIAATAISTWSALRARSELEQRTIAETIARVERDAAMRATYAAQMSAAISAYQSADFAQARRYLDEAPERHRGWEWRWMNSYLDQAISMTRAHRGWIEAMAADRDRSTLVTAGKDGEVRWWTGGGNAESARCVAAVPSGSSAPVAVTVTPSGARAAIVRAHGDVVVLERDGSSSSAIPIPIDDLGPFSRVAFVDESTLLLVSRAGAVSVASRATPDGAWAATRTFVDMAGATGIGVSDDGAVVGVIGRVGESADDAKETWISLRDASSLEERRRFTVAGDFGAIALNAAADVMALGGRAGRVRIAAISNNDTRYDGTLRDAVSIVRAVAVSGDGRLAAFGQGTSVITVLDTMTTGMVALGLGHRDAISGLAFSADGNVLHSSAWDGTIRAWDLSNRSRSLIRTLDGHEGRVLSVSFDPSGRMLASGGGDHLVRVWDLARPSNDESTVLAGHGNDVFDVDYAPDGRTLASASLDGTVRLWDLRDGARADAPFTELRGHTAGVWAVAFSPDGTLVVSGGDDRTAILWDARTKTRLATLEGHTARVTNVAFSGDGKRVATVSRDGTARLYRLDADGTVSLAHVLTGHGEDVFGVAFSPDDRRLYTGSRDQTVRVWDVATGAALATFDSVGQFVTTLAFVSDGPRLLAGTWFGGLAVLDPTTGERILTFRATADVLRGLDVSADGSRVAVGSGDGSIRIMDAGR